MPQAHNPIRAGTAATSTMRTMYTSYPPPCAQSHHSFASFRGSNNCKPGAIRGRCAPCELHTTIAPDVTSMLCVFVTIIAKLCPIDSAEISSSDAAAKNAHRFSRRQPRPQTPDRVGRRSRRQITSPIKPTIGPHSGTKKHRKNFASGAINHANASLRPASHPIRAGGQFSCRT